MDQWPENERICFLSPRTCESTCASAVVPEPGFVACKILNVLDALIPLRISQSSPYGPPPHTKVPPPEVK